MLVPSVGSGSSYPCYPDNGVAGWQLEVWAICKYLQTFCSAPAFIPQRMGHPFFFSFQFKFWKPCSHLVSSSLRAGLAGRKVDGPLVWLPVTAAPFLDPLLKMTLAQYVLGQGYPALV